MRAAALAVLAVLLLASAAPAALAATPKTSLPAIEDQFMCVECGTSLSVSQSPVADQERAFIRHEIVLGRTPAQIRRAMVAEYGPQVLAEPNGSGFDVTAWLVPAVLGLLAVAGVAIAARRWRRRRAPAAAADGTAALDPADAQRLDAELAAFDHR
jgi:cytochrome c-type biogenesis protein CcmH